MATQEKRPGSNREASEVIGPHEAEYANGESSTYEVLHRVPKARPIGIREHAAGVHRSVPRVLPKLRPGTRERHDDVGAHHLGGESRVGERDEKVQEATVKQSENEVRADQVTEEVSAPPRKRMPCPNHDSVAWCSMCGGPNGDRTIPWPMVKCEGCGFNVEYWDVVEYPETLSSAPQTTCLRCATCEAHPKMRESYRRGYNAGLDAAVRALTNAVSNTNLRRHPEPKTDSTHPEESERAP